MNDHITISAQPRVLNQHRNSHLVPAVIYGQKKENVHIAFNPKDLEKLFYNTAFHTNIIYIKIDGKEVSTLLKDWQLHPLNKSVMHLDFLRVNQKTEVDVKIPIRVEGQEICPGVAIDNGVVDHAYTAIDVKCKADAIPEALFLDISTLNLNDSIHFSDLKLPKGVSHVMEIDEDHDPMILAIHPPTKEEEIIPEEGEDELNDDIIDGEVEQPGESTPEASDDE